MSNSSNYSNNRSRRVFISNSLKAAGALALPVGLMSSSRAISNKPAGEINYTVQEIINIIFKEISGAPFNPTVDTIKSGSGDQRVTGIVTTMFPTVNVIKEAAKQNANFIIAHEPTFYNHADELNWVTPNEVVKQKQELLQKNQIAIWRFHDHWHMYKPDGIVHGFLKNTGWLPYYQPGKMLISIPKLSLQELIAHLKTSLGISHMRVIGDLSQTCEVIGMIPGAAPGQMQVSLIEKQKPDVLIVGELREWETAEYVRDSRLLGSKTALIITDHAVSEEPGMEWLVEWLKPKLPGLPITHIASGDPFIWV